MEDYWNPNMDQKQLDSYAIKFEFGGGFAKYFQNLWSAGSSHVFTENQIAEVGIMGCNGNLMNHDDVLGSLNKIEHHQTVIEEIGGRGLTSGVAETNQRIEEINTGFSYVNNHYRMRDKYSNPIIPDMHDLEKLSDMFDTYWMLCGGLDIADPLAIRSRARTIFTLVAKGLPNSRASYLDSAGAAPRFIYLLLYLGEAKNHTLDSLKEQMDQCHEEFDGIDILCSERYGAWDLQGWCEERDIAFEAVYPTYGRQKECFKELYTVVSEGRFKAPPVGVGGSMGDDILTEEMAVFDADEDRKWYGSLEKRDVNGRQDDSIYSLAWSIYGGRNAGVDDLRVRKGLKGFGEFLGGGGYAGNY